MPFEFKRVQFPFKLAFAITINNAQGQPLAICGIDLETDCFSHGQFYVACSRVANPLNLDIDTENNMCFQMTPFGADVITTQFMPTFKVKGQIYHIAGSLLPLPEGQHKYLQLYFIGDDEIELDARLSIFSKIHRFTTSITSSC